MSDKKLLFVYGSLLSGLHNHSYFLGRDKGEQVQLLGEWTTPPEYTMVAMGSFPGVLVDGNTAIKGELYAVSEAVYGAIEGLEGYPTFYTRSPLRTPLGAAELYVLVDTESRDYRNRYKRVEDGDWRRFYRERRVGYRGVG